MLKDLIEMQFKKISKNIKPKEKEHKEWPSDQLAQPPEAHIGTLGEIEHGKSVRFAGCRLPATIGHLYQEGEFDEQAYKYHAASLQLQNMELIEQITRKEDEYVQLSTEVDDLQ